MIVHTEPKDFFMFTVHFIFNQEHPDAEDAEVKAFLEEKKLYPQAHPTRPNIKAGRPKYGHSGAVIWDGTWAPSARCSAGL